MARKIQDDYHNGLVVHLAHRPLPGTNALFRHANGEIWLDAWCVEAATDRNVKAAIAHELGHLRGWADGLWPDLSEAVAVLYAERLWRFEKGDTVFKTEECLKLDKIARQVGLKAQVFFNGECYLILKDNQRLDLLAVADLDMIGSSHDEFEDIERTLRSYGRDEAISRLKVPRK